jgi:hypothetical protein
MKPVFEPGTDSLISSRPAAVPGWKPVVLVGLVSDSEAVSYNRLARRSADAGSRAADRALPAQGMWVPEIVGAVLVEAGHVAATT